MSATSRHRPRLKAAARLLPTLLVAVVLHRQALAATDDVERVQEPGGQPAPYTLEECIRIGIARSRRLANALRDEEIAGAVIRQVRAQALPSLDANSGYTRLNEAPSMPGVEGPMGREDNYRAALEAGQLLYSGGGVRAALRAARDVRTIAEYEVVRRRSELVRDITRSFYDVLFADAAVAVAAESVRQLEEFERQSQFKYKSGALAEFDWLSARVKAANERPRLIKARNDLALAKAAFRDLIYLEEDDYRLEGELSFEPVATDLEALQQAGLKARPELIQAEARISALQQGLRVARSDYLPEVRAFANYEGTNPDDAEPAEDEWGWGWNAGLTLSWAIMDGGLRRATVLEKALERAKAVAEQDDLKRQVQLEVKNACLALAHAREVVEGSREGVGLAEKALEIATARHERGLSTYLEFTDSNLALSSARLIHFEALRSYLQALADLRHACGTETLPGAQAATAPQPEVNP